MKCVLMAVPYLLPSMLYFCSHSNEEQGRVQGGGWEGEVDGVKVSSFGHSDTTDN